VAGSSFLRSGTGQKERYLWRRSSDMGQSWSQIETVTTLQHDGTMAPARVRRRLRQRRCNCSLPFGSTLWSGFFRRMGCAGASLCCAQLRRSVGGCDTCSSGTSIGDESAVIAELPAQAHPIRSRVSAMRTIRAYGNYPVPLGWLPGWFTVRRIPTLSLQAKGIRAPAGSSGMRPRHAHRTSR